MDVFLTLCTIIGGIAALGWFVEKAISSRRRSGSGVTTAGGAHSDTNGTQVSATKALPVANQSSETDEVLVPGRVNDLIYKGHAGVWDEILEAYQEAKQTEELSPRERLTLAASYNIARFWKLAYSDQHIIFFDSSWLLHGSSFWITDPEMHRWLSAQEKVAKRRVQHGRRTTRVFYCAPDSLDTNIALMDTATTIMEHLTYGIDVYVVSPDHWSEVLDFGLHSKRHGLISSDFSGFRIDQLKGASELEMGFN